MAHPAAVAHYQRQAALCEQSTAVTSGRLLVRQEAIFLRGVIAAALEDIAVAEAELDPERGEVDTIAAAEAMNRAAARLSGE